MTDLFIPEHDIHEHRITELVIVHAVGATDLTDPVTRRTVIPQIVELELNRLTTPDEDREWANVRVLGPRRLKSGLPGKDISSLGWEGASRYGCYGATSTRPEWLTTQLSEVLPDGWARHLLDLPSDPA